MRRTPSSIGSFRLLPECRHYCKLFGGAPQPHLRAVGEVELDRLKNRQRRNDSMPKYDVHTYAVVRVKLTNVDAGDPRETARRADELLNLYEFRGAQIGGAAEVEWAEDIQDYLIDATEGNERTTFVIDRQHHAL